MGKRGPAPAPTAVLKIRGSWRAKVREQEPQPDVGEPSMPELSEDEVKVWEQLVEQLSGMLVLTTVDGWELERYACYCVRWRTERTKLRRGKLTPQMQWLCAQMVKFEDRFGLSPSARARLRVEKPKERQAKSRFFRQA